MRGRGSASSAREEKPRNQMTHDCK
jgi:hypothetical protein